MIVGWTFIPDGPPETEGDYVLPRYDGEALARHMAKEEAKRTGRAQQLCKLVVTEHHDEGRSP